MSEALYEKMRERWIDFLNVNMCLAEPENEEHLMDMYDDLAHEFCEEHGYSQKTEEFAFHGRWYDTFVDEYCKKLKDKGWEGFDNRVCDERLIQENRG